MNRRLFFLCCVATVVAAAIAAYVVVQMTLPKEAVSEPPSNRDFHEWLHENLEITENQARELHDIEHAWEKEHETLAIVVRDAGKRLAEAIQQEPVDRSKVDHALAELVAAQQKLHSSTLDHFLVMKTHLSPEQGEKLLRWTRDSIVYGKDL